MTNKNQVFSVEGDTERCIGRVIHLDRPLSLAEFVVALEGRPLNYVEQTICDMLDKAADLPPERLVVHVPYKSGRIVPRALTDVQRRGGRGTP